MDNMLARAIEALDNGIHDAIIRGSWKMQTWLDGPYPEEELDQAIRSGDAKEVDRAIKAGATSRTLYDLVRDNLSRCKTPDDPERLKILEVLINNRDSLSQKIQGRTNYKLGGSLAVCLDFNNPLHFKAIEKAMRQDNIEYVNIAPDIKRAIENGRTDVVKTSLESSYFQKNASTSLLVDALETGNKEIAKTLLSLGADPTCYNSHAALVRLDKAYSKDPSRENEKKIKFALGCYSDADRKEIQKNNPINDHEWGPAILNFCKMVSEKGKDKKQEEVALSM